jgi:hypothetical protein
VETFAIIEQQAASRKEKKNATGLFVWKHSGVLLRVPIGQDVVVIGNGLVVVLGQGGPAQSPRVSELLLDGALCKRCKVCPSFSPRCDSSSELRYHFSHWPFYYNIHE